MKKILIFGVILGLAGALMNSFVAGETNWIGSFVVTAICLLAACAAYWQLRKWK